MANWKKYEGYIDDKKIYTINFNKDLMKKILSVSLAGIINIGTLAGCSYVRKENISVNNIVQTLEFENIDNEIFSKQYFVDSALEVIYDNNAEVVRNMIMEPYKQVKKNEYEIDPKNEYSAFLTEEDIYRKKSEMLLGLNDAIKIIEDNTKFRYGIDYIPQRKSK